MYGTEPESLTRGHVSCLCAWLLKYIVYAWEKKKEKKKKHCIWILIVCILVHLQQQISVLYLNLLQN